MIKKLIDLCPKEIDLTNDKHSELITEIVELLLDEGYGISELDDIENKLISKKDDSMVFILLALKIAKSKIIVSQTTEPVLVSIVFAIYKEHNRIKKFSEHPHGEDFLLKYDNWNGYLKVNPIFNGN